MSAGNLQLLDGETLFPPAGGGEVRKSKKMKKLALMSAILIQFLVSAKGSDYIAFSPKNNGTNAIVIPENEVWQLITYSSTYTWFEVYSSTNQTAENLIGYLGYHHNSALNPTSAVQERNGCVNITLIGPAYIYNGAPFASETTLNKYYLVFKKLHNSNPVPASVVIPSSASGDVEVILEQSQDGATWTQCLPGTYNSSTVKRFFRLRAVEK